jgi:hypothetical protein
MLGQNDLLNVATENGRSDAELSALQSAASHSPQHLVGTMQQELLSLQCEHAAIRKRIHVVKKTLTGLVETFGLDIAGNQALQSLIRQQHNERSHPGLTDTCRLTLMRLSQPLTTNELCDRIETETPHLLDRHKYPKVSVYVVLKRLAGYGQALEGINEEGKRTWLWVGPRSDLKTTSDERLF